MSKVKDTQQYPKVEIAVKNFGPIAEANIDLRPLTVFVGRSNTGKTYLSTLVYALHGVFSGFSGLVLLDPLKVGWFLEIGRRIQHRLSTDVSLQDKEILDVFTKLIRGRSSFKLTDVPVGIRSQLQTIMRNPKEIMVDTLQDTLQSELKNCFDLNSISALMRLAGQQPNEMAVYLRVSEENQEFWNINMTVSESDITLGRFANEEMILLPAGEGVLMDFFGTEDGFKFDFNANWIKGNRYYLPAARSGIMQSHRIMANSLVKLTTRIGMERLPEVPTLSGVIADFMEGIILYEEKKTSNDEMKHLAEILESDVLAGQVLLKLSPSGYPDFRYLPQGTNEDIRISQSSSMVSELAPLVLYLRGLVQSGDTLIIEEPEAHLHPGAQADIAVILARLVRAGVRVIITTHSDWLLQEIGNLVLEGLLEDETDQPASWLLPEEVGVWHFQKDEPVKEIPFKPREGLSPEDYEDVAEGLYNRSVNLQQRFEKKKGEDERESS